MVELLQLSRLQCRFSEGYIHDVHDELLMAAVWVQDLEEDVAHAAARVREAMHRKGQQIQQLRQYTAVLKT